MSDNQTTLRAVAEIAGRGLFSGVDVRTVFRPAPADTGIEFVRTDLPGKPRVKACPENLVKKPRRTALLRGEAQVDTVEHVLAALAGLEIDNAIVEVDAPEMPTGDGSALPFVETLLDAGKVELDAPRTVFELPEPFMVSEGDASIMAMPNPTGLSLIYNLDYDGNAIPSQSFMFQCNPERFPEDVAPARTFCLEEEVETFRRQGVGLGATYENTLIVSADGSIVENTRRFDDEFARHKMLDLIGDVSLLGAKLKARVVAVRSGHSLNMVFVNRLRSLMRERKRDQARSVVLDIRHIQRILPHRYPMLLIDRVTELDGDCRVVGIKNVTVNEEFFRGHFPDRPIMPGVLQIEAMAQMAGVLLLRRVENTGKLAVLTSITDVNFRRPIVPGDQMQIEAVAERVRSRTARVRTRVEVDGRLASEARLTFMLIDAESDETLDGTTPD